MTVTVSMTINGQAVAHTIEERTLLVTYIRDICRLTGTHIGCDTSQCGACTVHLDGKAVKSCNVLALQAAGAHVTTIEGLVSNDGALHPMQQAFKTHHGLQCGYCTPGMVMSAIHLPKSKFASNLMVICAAALVTTTSSRRLKKHPRSWPSRLD